MDLYSADHPPADAMPGSEGRTRGAPNGPALPREVVDRLGALLLAYYRDLQQEPVPEHLIRIINQGRRSTGGRDGH